MGIIRILKGEQPDLITTILNYRNRGQFGEFAIEYALKNNNISGDFIILKNAYIPYNNKITEIDIIMLHTKGIFVFESKNYNGSVYGDEDETNWVQISKNGNKHIFYNPIKQNNAHIIALERYLGLKSFCFTSYIVFSEKCKLNKVPKSTDDIIIICRHKMLRHIRKMLKDREVIYTYEQLKEFERKIKPYTRVSDDIKMQHIKSIRKKNEKMQCPFCGKKLVKRNGKYGEFIGCTGYPKCKYTREIDK